MRKRDCRTRFRYKGKQYCYIDYNDFTEEILPEIHPCTEGKHKDEYAELPVAFDIETSNIDDAHASMYVWALAIKDDTIIGRTWQQFKECLTRISRHYDLIGTDTKLLCWVHNLSFEWAFLRKWFEYKKGRKGKEVFATGERKVIYACTDLNIEFRDSYILTSRPLAALPKAYGFADRIQKLTGEVDYNLLRNCKTTLTYADLAYSINDVQILSRWHRVYIVPNFIRPEKKIPLTSTGIVRAELKASFKAMEKKAKAKMKKALYNAFPTESVYKVMIRWLYRGGFVHSNRALTDEVLQLCDIGSFDFKSSYPAVMLHNDFPWEFVKKPSKWFWTFVYPNKDHIKLKTFAWHGCLRFTNIRAKTTHSLESVSKLYASSGVMEDNGRLVKADSITVCLCDVDFDSYCDLYTWDKVECLDLFVADKKPLPEYLKDIVLEYFWKKETYDKADPERDLAKYKLNSCYGMCVTGLFNETFELNDDNDLEQVSSDYSWDKIRRKQILLPQWGIWVSAYARRNLVKSMVKCSKYSIAYCDTDSLKMIHTAGNQWVIDAYNDEMRRLNGKMYVGKYDRAIFKDLGIFDYEGKYMKFKTLGAKRYIYSTADYNKDTKHYQLSDHVTIAGLPKKSLLRYTQDKDLDIYEQFAFNLEIGEEYADKLKSKYIDEEFSIEVTDYRGDTAVQAEKSCISLSSTTFSMKGTQDYIALLAMIVEQRSLRIGRH